MTEMFALYKTSFRYQWPWQSTCAGSLHIMCWVSFPSRKVKLSRCYRAELAYVQIQEFLVLRAVHSVILYLSSEEVRFSFENNDLFYIEPN